MPDPELDAMSAVHDALDLLDGSARERVLRWAAAKFEVGFGATTSQGSRGPSTVEDRVSEAENFEEVGDLVHAAQPTSGPEHALVVGYWFQEVQGRDAWAGADINSTLKNMGAGLANVTKTLDSLKAKRPALVMQIGKSGRSRQARKTYKLTSAGVREVRQMIANAAQAGAA